MNTAAQLGSATRRSHGLPRRRKELKAGEGLHLSVRLEPDMAHQIDDVIKKLAASTGLTVSRTDVVRLLLREALEARAKRSK